MNPATDTATVGRRLKGHLLRGLSIRARILLALNLVALAVALSVGTIAGRQVRRTIEQRLVQESVRNMADLAGELRLPPTRRLMEQLSRISGADLAARDLETDDPLAANLSPAAAAELAARPWEDLCATAWVVLKGSRYRVATAAVPMASAPASVSRYGLVLLLPAEQLRDAQRRAMVHIGTVSAGAVIAATLLGFWLATAISRPVRDLVRHVDRLVPESEVAAGAAGGRIAEFPASDHAAPGPGSGRASFTQTGMPVEIQRLWHSFERLESRLGTAQQHLARSSRLAAVGQMAATIAHEIRNPLSGMKMNARVLVDELREQAVDTTSVEWILREIDRLDRYVSELLNLRAVTGAGPGAARSGDQEPEAFPLEREIRNSVKLLHPRAEHCATTVRVHCPETAPLVYGYPEKIRQVLTNLLLNALDAVAGCRHRTVDISVAEESCDLVSCTVADSGPGIEANPEQLFEPFFTTRPHGTGLGLYICKQILDAQGGHISCASTEDGAAFRFELPRARSHAKETDTATD